MSNKISSITFSKDRACQAKLHLDSLKENGGGLFYNPTLLYNYSNSDFCRGYISLFNMGYLHNDSSMMKDTKFTTFKDTLLYLINRIDSKYICFFTDDDILYRKLEVSYEDVDHLFSSHPNIEVLSLRLGDNINIQDPSVQSHCAKPVSTKYKDFFIWTWNTMDKSDNFGYPLSVDGHIFERKMLLETLPKVKFHDPNSLEYKWQDELGYLRHQMACLPLSHVINTPVNRVQETMKNAFGGVYEYDQEWLNNKFLEGKSIDLSKMDFSGIQECHKELEFTLS